MSDKLNFLPISLSQLQSYSLLVLEGADAVAFIQAQSMNDVSALTDGQWHWNGLLNPKGRVIALFALIRHRSDLLYIVLPDFPAEKLCTQLQRFIFRSKVKLRTDTDNIIAAEFNPVVSSEVPRDCITGDFETGFVLNFCSDTDSRRLWIVPKNLKSQWQADRQIDAQWRDADILHGLPRLAMSQSEQWTPQMLSLEHLNAFSLKKGCYPGQEIVARTHYLGQAKRRTRLIHCDNLAIELPVYRAQEKVGQVICITSKGDLGLAMLQNVTDLDALVCGENPVKLQPVYLGLQRPMR